MSDQIPFTRYRQQTIGMKTWPTEICIASWNTLTSSQAIQQSHFLSAERNCATNIRTVTHASRYGTGSEGIFPGNTTLPTRLMNHPHPAAITNIETIARIRWRQFSIVTLREPLSSELCSPLRG